MFRGAFKFFDNLSLRFSLYRIFTFSHLRFPHFLFVISYWQFSFSAVVVAVAVVVLNFPSYQAVRCLHPYVCSHCVCVCLYAIHSDCYLRIFTCAFLWLPLFSMTASIRGISAFFIGISVSYKTFRSVSVIFFSRSFIIAPNLNRVVRWNRADDNEQQH